MSTLATWIEDVRAHLDGPGTEEGNQLDADYAPAAGTLTLRYALGSVTAGTVLSVGANTFRVFSTNPIAKTVTVVAGYAGSTDAAATAGSLVRVNPRFTDHRIIRSINGALATISSPSNGLYQTAAEDITVLSGVDSYDLGTIVGLLNVLDVRRQVSGTSLAWPRVPYDLIRSANTIDFPSGLGLKIRDVCALEVGYALRVVYGKAFTEITDVTANVTTTGIPATAEDIPPLGAAIRLMAGREIGRNNLQAQGDSRRATEVPPGAVAASYRGVLSLFAQRVAEESTRLRAAYPLTRG